MNRSLCLRAHFFAGCISMSACGGSDVLQYGEYNVSAAKQLKPHQVLVRNSFAGVNFIDVYYRSGLYKDPSKPFPLIPGQEGAGTIIAVGDASQSSLIGRRVAFYRSASGSYSTFSVSNREDLFDIPDKVPDQVAAALLLQGCTANYLANDCFPVAKGHIVVVHAAAGGTGLLLCQMCHYKGATVIGVCGGSTKSEAALRIGRAQHVVDYVQTPDWDAEVRRICKDMGCEGADVVFDGVGKSTFDRSCSVLRKRGAMISFGNASGAVPPLSPLALTGYGSISLQRPKLDHFMDVKSGEAARRIASVFDDVAKGKIEVTIAQEFPLRKAALAHDLLESKKSIGKIVLNCAD